MKSFQYLVLSTLFQALFVCSIAMGDTIGGQLTLTYVDYPDGSHELEHSVATADGKLIEIVFSQASLKDGLQPGMEVALEGEYTSEGVFQVYGVAILAQLTDAEMNPTVSGSRTTIVMLLNFNDRSLNGATCTAAQVASRMYSADVSVNKVMEDSSYGNLSFPGSTANVVGPYSLATSGATCDPYAWASLADDEATNAGVNLDNYQHRVYVLPSNIGCSWAGLGNVGCSGSFCRSWVAACESELVFAHELGHNLGMAHASTDPDDDGSVNSEYGDSSCIMGNSGSWKHFNAPHKDQLGWLNTNQITETLSGDYNLYELNSDPSAVSGPQALKIDAGDGTYYYLSFRKNGALYNGLSSTYDNRVSVHRYVGSGYDNTKVIDSLQNGETVTLGRTAISVTVNSLGTEFASISLGSPDTDGDGRSDAQEVADGTNPNDPNSVVEELESPIYLLWNGFLSMTNILELVNPGSSEQVVTVKLFDATGSLTFNSSYAVAASSQLDLILNGMTGFEADSYGIVQVEFSGQLDGRASYYRSLDMGASYEFAYSIPFSNATTGVSALGYNTFDPSTGSESNQILNWLTVVNVASSEKEFTVETFDQNGSLLTTRELRLESFGRADIDGGHGIAGASAVGFHRITPADGSASYLALLKRYSTRGSVYNFAFPLLADKGITDSTAHLPISRQFGEENWVEITNISDSSVEVSVQFYDEAGTLERTESGSMAPRSQINYYANAFLDNGQTGYVKIVPETSGAIAAQSLFYLSGSSSVYARQAGSAFGRQLNGSYNLFLSAENWLRLANTTSSSLTITVDVDGVEQALTLGANSTTSLPIHDSSTYATSADTYGFLNITSSGAGVLADLVRLRYQGDEADFSFPTVLRTQ